MRTLTITLKEFEPSQPDYFHIAEFNYDDYSIVRILDGRGNAELNWLVRMLVDQLKEPHSDGECSACGEVHPQFGNCLPQ